MKKIIFTVSVLISAALLVSACATLADAEAAKGTGPARIYNQPYDVVWDATIKSIKSSHLDLVVQNKQEGKILAQRGMTLLSYGENVAIFVQRTANKKTRVEVENKRALATNITAKNWANYIFDDLDKRLQ